MFSSPYLLVFQKQYNPSSCMRGGSLFPDKGLFSILFLLVTNPAESFTSTVERTMKVSSAFPHDSHAAHLPALLLIYQPYFFLL